MNNVTTITTQASEMYSKEVPTLEEMNAAEVQRLIPTIIFLLIICVVGMIGNVLVIHVYRTRYKMSNSKCFILCLSAVDLLTCCFAIPLEITTVLEQYTFEHLWLCKTTRVFNTLGTISSSFILLFIAVDRFRKVCKPFGWQIHTSVAKFLCALAIFLGLLVSWPAFFVYGKHSFNIKEFNMTGTECSTADEITDTKFPFYYALVFGFMFIAGIISMSILYCFIGHKVRKHTNKMKKTFGRNMSIPMTSSIIETPDSKLTVDQNPNGTGKYDVIDTKNEKEQKKRSTKKKKQESDDSWTDKKEYELSYTCNTESIENNQCENDINKKENNKNKEIKEEKEAHHSDSDDSGIKIKDDADVNENKETKTVNSEHAKASFKKRQISFQHVEIDEVKMQVSPTSSEEILPKQQRGVIRRISSISYRISNAVMRRVTSITSARADSDTGDLKRTQFLKQARARKTAFLMFVVTLGFILSFLPHLLLMLIRQIKSDFVDGMSETNKAVYKFFLRSYFLNSAINPVIYSICDSRFKAACKEIFEHCCRRSPSRKLAM